MKKWQSYSLFAIVICVAYTIGSTHPLKLFQFEYDETHINRAEHIKIFVAIVSAFLTFCAVTVALFKEKILGIFTKPKLSVEKPETKANFEIITDKKQVLRNETLEATKYLSRLIVKNTGNTVALDVAISLEKLEFKEHGYDDITNEFEPTGESLIWSNNQNKINILPNSQKLINIVEIFAPIKTSTPEGKTELQQNTELVIGNFTDCEKKSRPGKWQATFVLHAQNHKHITFTVDITWQGKWKGRLTDFENEYSYKIKSII